MEYNSNKSEERNENFFNEFYKAFFNDNQQQQQSYNNERTTRTRSSGKNERSNETRPPPQSSNQENNDLYKVLGVPKTSSLEEIKKAFRRKLLMYHPDQYKGNDLKFAQEQTQKVVEAFKVLSNEKKRSEYDRLHHS